MNSQLPICVDLDGTLITTDTIIESAVRLIKSRPSSMFLMPFWLAKGKANLKHQIARRVSLDVTLLPYNQPLLSWLKEQKAAGRSLTLATASDKTVAQKIASQLGIFDHVVASDGQTNMSSLKKAQALTTLHGTKQFCYAGNSRADLAVWHAAGSAIVVNAAASIVKAAGSAAAIEKIFPRQPLSFQTIAKTIRIHQWVKNLLLFVPLIAAHKVADIPLLISATIAALSFCCMASAIYIMNDLFDVEADRSHHTKKFRPLAAGTIPPLTAITIAGILGIASLALALPLPPRFAIALALYVIINLAYSSTIKQIALLDVITLSSLYVLRILAGGVATHIVTSSWLFVFAMFLFTSLALVKRFSELTSLARQNKDKAIGRGYTSEDRQLLGMLGIASGFISLLVLALYISSDAVTNLYHTPMLLWLMIPLMLFWISRLWLLAYRGQMHEDPIMFAIKDSPSYLVLVGTLIIVISGTL